MSSALYHYAVVRTDLPVGVAAAQLLHAVAYTATRPDTRAVVLQVSNEPELYYVWKQLEIAKIPCYGFVESEGPYSDQMTALALVPRPKLTDRNPLRDLKLYGTAQ